MTDRSIPCRYLSQEDLLRSGCLDPRLAMDAAATVMRGFREGRVLFPDKIVQIFDEATQSRINCLPATLLDEQVCGVKWVSVFPPNPERFGLQNLTAVIVLSEIERGFPIAFMEGTLCSNLRVAAMGGLAAEHLARDDASTIGFIGAGEQAKMHLLAMASVRPTLRTCRVGAKTDDEAGQFVEQMTPLLPEMTFVATGPDLAAAVDGADIVVTATSAQAPLLRAEWLAPGVFYSHIGGWEDEYAVAELCDKIVCDEWETVKHRTQTLSRMYAEGRLTDDDIHADLVEIILGDKPGRESPDERIYFNAVGLAYVDVAIAHAMYRRALDGGAGTELTIQETTIFEHEDLADWVRR
ncbi:MAG: ornithine cyclodeaminase family protein [Ilumatobacter sp.]|nr:MAG: ornithine cyclodeaminase family protein [Ilumatobacter sp.]